MIKDVEKTVDAGSEWLRDYVSGSGKKVVVVGLSGGLDSATAFLWALRTFATKPELGVTVVPVMMPYGLPEEKTYLTRSSAESVNDAVELITQEQLKHRVLIENYLLPITAPVDAVIDTLGIAQDPDFELAKCNLKARMRAVYLRTISNGLDGIILGTENLTENLLGYFTIGGDEESDIEMLSTFSKREVRELATYLGVTPTIIGKAPSADLWAGQTDEGELGFTYEDADAIVEQIREDGTVPAPVAMTDAQVKVITRIKQTDFKRRNKPTFTPVRGIVAIPAGERPDTLVATVHA